MIGQCLKSMRKEEAPPPRAFFDITPEEANENAPSPPPGSILVGSLGADHSGSTLHQPHGMVDSSQGAKTDDAKDHFSGQVSATLGGDLAFMPVAEKAVEGWRRFFLGMVAPWIAIGLLVIFSVLIDNGYDNYETSETITVDADDNGTVNAELAPPSSMHTVSLSYGMNQGYLWMTYSPYYGDDASDALVYEYDYDGGESVIGAYNPSTGDLTMTIDEWANQSLALDIWYHDDAADDRFVADDALGVMASCCLPILYVGSVIGAFVRGEKRLGWGLLTAIPMGLIIIPVTLFLFFAFIFGL